MLDDHIKGIVAQGVKPAPDTVLTMSPTYMAQRGFPLTRAIMMAFAWAIVKRAGNAETQSKSKEHGKALVE